MHTPSDNDEPVDVDYDSIEVEQDRLERCEVTGELTPVDEITVFQGKRVSPAGKRILMRELVGGRPFGDSLPRPSFFRRFLCYLADFLVVACAASLVSPIVLFFVSMKSGLFSLIMDAIRAGLFFAYAAYMHGKYGKTLGKMLGKCRVVDLDGNRCGMHRAVVRAFFTTGVGVLPILFAPFSDVILYLLAFAVFLYYLADAVVLLGDQRHERAVHDLVSGTRVIWEWELENASPDEQEEEDAGDGESDIQPDSNIWEDAEPMKFQDVGDGNEK